MRISVQDEPSTMNEEIERYVRSERSRGADEASIRHALIAKGWEVQIVDYVIASTRPGPIASLFSRSFFRFTFGFITVITFAVGLILVIGVVSNGDSSIAATCIGGCD